VGAIVLVTIAVMILPMVLDQEPQPVTQDIAITIPPKRDARSFAPKAVAPPAVRPPVAPKPAEPAAEPMAAAETEKAKGEPPGLEKPAEPAPAPRTAAPQAGAKPVEAPAAARTEAKPEPKTEAKPDAAARTEAFVVQLDAFSNPENARQQQKKLSSAGISSYTDTVKTAKGELTRVRVGPYSTRQQAEQMRERIRRIGMNAVVVAK
jgi:DedD protein